MSGSYRTFLLHALPPRLRSRTRLVCSLRRGSPAIAWIESQVSSSFSASLKLNSDVPGVSLSDEQKAALEIVSNGQNLFFTGSAGTGKSVLLREIIKTCSRTDQPRIVVTASTGTAALNIGGKTLHSWAGVGLGKVHVNELMSYMHRGRYKEESAVDRWRNAEMLIIDEISMIDAQFFDKLEHIARWARNNNAPFGGLQLVLSGDFLQLPPVWGRIPPSSPIQEPPRVPPLDLDPVPSTAWKRKFPGDPEPDVTPYFLRAESPGCPRSIFAFDAHSWEKCISRCVVLNRVYRQKDKVLVDVLESIRFGRINPWVVSTVQLLEREVVYNDGIEPTNLFPTMKEVHDANNYRLNRLSTPARSFTSVDQEVVSGKSFYGAPASIDQVKTWLKEVATPELLTLKAGAQVMLTKNRPDLKLVNGSLGLVVGFCPISGWPIVRFTNGETHMCLKDTFEAVDTAGRVRARRKQVPLVLAWAMTIHKSQGQSIERLRVDLDKVFEAGQAYVALSRARSMETLQVVNFRPERVMARPRVTGWMENLTMDRQQQLSEKAPAGASRWRHILDIVGRLRKAISGKPVV